VNFQSETLEMSGFPFTSGVEGVRYITTPDIFYLRLQNTKK